MNESTLARRVLVLGTGGTIAGRAVSKDARAGYLAGQVGVDALLAGIEAPPRTRLALEQLAQIDSKDMDFAVWRALALRCAQALADPGLAAIVVTHGTDTLEETAFFLHRVLAADKPVLLTCAMRPADAPAPDGPQNLRDALAVAATPGARGVMALCAGRLHGAQEVQKVHTWRLDAFSSGDAGVLGHVEEGALRRVRAWPAAAAMPGAIEALGAAARLPRVEIVMSHADADGRLIDMLVREREAGAADAAQGLVLAATGNGTLHARIEAAALRAQAAGIAVVRATRCGEGRILPRPGAALPDAGALSPVKARIALALELLVAARGGRG